MNRRLVATAVVLLPAIALIASGSCTTKFKPPPNAPGLTRTVTPDSVQTIFDGNCAFDGCHAGPSPPHAQMDLSADSSYTMIVNRASIACAPLKRVLPFDPNNSCLMDRITGRVTPQMPLGGTPLPGADTTTIHNWIKQGAPGVVKPV